MSEPESVIPSTAVTPVTWSLLREIAVGVQKKYYPAHSHADDLVQEAIIQVVHKLAKVKYPITSPRSFIFVNMRNIMSNYSYHMSKYVDQDDTVFEVPCEDSPYYESGIEVSMVLKKIYPLITQEQVPLFASLIGELLSTGFCSPKSFSSLTHHEARIFAIALHHIKLFLQQPSKCVFVGA